MGEGLYHDPDGVTAYAEPTDHLTGHDDDDRRLAWEDFSADVLSLLSDAWFRPDRRWKGRARVLAQNGLHVLTLYEDSYARAHLTIAIRTDRDAAIEALARARLPDAATRFFDALHGLHPLRVRTCPWTSAPYRPTARRVAGARPGPSAIPPVPEQFDDRRHHPRDRRA